MRAVRQGEDERLKERPGRRRQERKQRKGVQTCKSVLVLCSESPEQRPEGAGPTTS